MKQTITISKPYIKEEKSDIFDKSVKLCAEITMINPNTNIKETKECYFEFEKEYKNYLCPERSDAFVMGLLTSAMESNMDIKFESPISERLYYQLMTYYIPLISKYNPSFPMNNIKLIGPVDNTIIQNKKAVATGCSGGVDSFYTILKHGEKCETQNNKLTHLVYSSSGTNDTLEKRKKEIFKNTYLDVKKIAVNCDLKVIGCYNNLYMFYRLPLKAFTTFFTTTFGSVAYALEKLISIYYVSSGDPISEFNLDLSKTHGHDSSVFDIFTVSCMNTENLTFYSSGAECSRIEKELYISDYKPAQKHLTVCQNTPYIDKAKNKFNNCSVCSKCLRTMAHFYSFNKLDNFKEVFNVNDFKKHKSKYLGKMMGTNKKSYVQDMKQMAKKNNVKIPFTSYFYMYLWYKPLTILKKIFKWSTFARKIYYKLKLDVKLNGFRDPLYEAYKDKIK